MFCTDSLEFVVVDTTLTDAQRVSAQNIETARSGNVILQMFKPNRCFRDEITCNLEELTR